MKGNPYATENTLYTEDANNSATVSATMALAFEQRTANLLAMHAALDNRREYRKALDVLKLLNERLGLDD